jgi:FHS family glucose/mannose:H+ symporter-like MFS transporter
MYNKKLVFWSACTGMFLFGVCLITLGSVVPDLKEKLALSEIDSGTLFSIMPLGILAGSLIFGPVADRYGYKLLLSVASVFLAAGFEGIAWSESAGLLRIFIFIVGLSGGVLNGATNALVSDISEHDKGANLSLLGVFFGIGALGMPLLLGILRDTFSFEVIVAAVGIISFAAGVFFILIKFPLPKQAGGFNLSAVGGLFKDPVLLLIAFFLFFQSSFEGIINNWTTSYLTGRRSAEPSQALYGLSLFVAGMVIMRLLIGTLLRNVGLKRLLGASFAMILFGLILLKTGSSLTSALMGLMVLGAGLAAGFPVMLGFTGERYKELSGTAFSFVLAVGLLGNMFFNYCMGIISQNYGIGHLTTVALGEALALGVLCIVILRKLKRPTNP